MMLQEAAVVPLWYDMVIRLVHNEIKGFNPNSLNLLELRTARK
jgi:peptide/nickel transport system substrate-binding protein